MNAPEGHGRPVVSLSGVSFSYGSNAVLRDIDLDFASGSITALLGANGAGKSTLIKALSPSPRRRSHAVTASPPCTRRWRMASCPG
jgi:simple sugar transport system ATP-binding protein